MFLPNTFFFETLFSLNCFTDFNCRKRGRKTKAKVGRKKAKTTETVEITTPRTRAAVAREVAARAASTTEAASASEPPTKRYDPLFPVFFLSITNQIAFLNLYSRIALDGPLALEDTTTSQPTPLETVVHILAKKMTPKKQLATKVLKPSVAKKLSPKKGATKK